MIINLKNKLYILYLFITGFLIVLLHLYFRLFRSRETYSLEALRGNLSQLGLLLPINFILIQMITIISLLYFLYKQYYNIERTSKVVVLISKIVDHLYWKPLEYIHDIIVPDLPYSGTFIIYITEFVEKGKKDLRYKLYRHSYILFEYLPQLIVSSIFFIDIVIYNQFRYFLYVIILLIIPLLYKIYVKLYMSFVIRNLPEHLEVLDIIPQGEPNENGIYLKFKCSLKPKYVQDKYILEEYIYDYLLLLRIEAHAKAIKKNSGKYYPYMLLFTSSLYLSAAIYRLIYILF